MKQSLNGRNIAVAIVASTFLAVVPSAHAQAGQKKLPAKASLSTGQGHYDPSLLLTIGTNASVSLAGIRPTGRFSHHVQVGLKWKTPWKGWDRIGFGVGTLINPVIRSNYEKSSFFHYSVSLSGHIRRPLNKDWSLWISAGPIVDCYGCRALVDFGFVASAAIEYNSSVSATIGTQVIGYDLGRAGRPLGTEVNAFGGIRVRGKAAYLGILPWVLILGLGVASALPSHT